MRYRIIEIGKRDAFYNDRGLVGLTGDWEPGYNGSSGWFNLDDESLAIRERDDHITREYFFAEVKVEEATR